MLTIGYKNVNCIFEIYKGCKIIIYALLFIHKHEINRFSVNKFIVFFHV